VIGPVVQRLTIQNSGWGAHGENRKHRRALSSRPRPPLGAHEARIPYPFWTSSDQNGGGGVCRRGWPQSHFSS